MPSKNFEVDFRPITGEKQVAGTSYRFQLGLINGKWASRLLIGQNYIDLYVYNNIEIPLSTVEESREKIESLMKKESVDELLFERQYLPEFFDEIMWDFSIEDGLPCLKGFAEVYFRGTGIITQIYDKVIRFFRGNEPIPFSEFLKLMDKLRRYARKILIKSKKKRRKNKGKNIKKKGGGS